MDLASWLKLKAYATDRLADLAAVLEGDRDQIETARLRGQIAELRAILTEFEPRH